MMTVFIDEIVYTYLVTRVTFNLAWPPCTNIFPFSSWQKIISWDKKTPEVAFLSPTFLWTLTALPPSSIERKKQPIICTTKKAREKSVRMSIGITVKSHVKKHRVFHPMPIIQFILGFRLFTIIFHLFAMEMRFFNNQSVPLLFYWDRFIVGATKKVGLFHSLATVNLAKNINSMPRSRSHIYWHVIKTHELLATASNFFFD